MTVRLFKNKSTGVTWEIADVEHANRLAANTADYEEIEQAQDVDAPDEIKHVGGGMFELPNGDRIKGKEAAAEAWSKIKESQ